jgi:two-component system, OmpR family, phosphate regulon response regulator PhoB
MLNHVLVVKNNGHYREVLQQGLHHSGFWATGAGTVVDALTQVSDIAPDLIVLDLDLDTTQVGAVEVCRQLKDHPVGQMIPIVLCTPQQEAAYPEWGLAQGAQACLQKPFDMAHLVTVLHHLLAKLDVA